jgi:hypothetical protein
MWRDVCGIKSSSCRTSLFLPSNRGCLVRSSRIPRCRQARRGARNRALPTSAVTASPPLPPTPGAASSRTWNCAAGAARGAKTASAMPKTPGCATSRCTTLTRTRSGASSPPWPARTARLDADAHPRRPPRLGRQRLRLRLFTTVGAWSATAVAVWGCASPLPARGNPRPPGATAGNRARPGAETGNRPQPHPDRSRSRSFEARVTCVGDP